MNSWMKSKETCEGPQNSGTTQGSFGTLPSRREVLDYLKGKPLSGDKWIPTSEGNNVWLQVGKRGSRANHSPDYALLHTDIPDVAYTKSGEAGKPGWGITNAKHSFRNVLFCKTPPDGQTWDKEGSKWVRVANITQTGSGGATSITGGTSAIAGKYAITTSISKGSKNIPLTNAQAKGFKIGQKSIIGTPPNTELRTIVGFGG